MSLITHLKMGAVNNLSDARCAAGFGASYLGFCLDSEDSQFISIEQIKQITDWIDGPQIVGEFGNQNKDEINQISIKLKLDMIQLNNYRPHFDLTGLRLPLIQSVTINNETDISTTNEILNKLNNTASIFILSTDVRNSNGKSHIKNKSFLNQIYTWSKSYKLILDFPFNLENILEIVKTTNVYGINIKGGTELKPGYRDYDELIDMIELLES